MTGEQLQAFIRIHQLAVIATFGEEYPESAVIEFGDNGLELIFDTRSTTRKYQNLMRNPNVSFVIGWDEGKTVQYEGVATRLIGRETEHYKRLYFAKNPAAQTREHDDGITYFKVIPKWIRYSDFSKQPWIIKKFTM